LREQLNELPGLHPLTPPDPHLSGALLTFALDRGDSGEIRNRLNQEHQIVVKGAQGTYAYCQEEGLPRENYNAIRFSTHIFNDEAEIDRCVDILGSLLAEA
jgi:selenocysteine lyase/cysteine desulfurase